MVEKDLAKNSTCGTVVVINGASSSGKTSIVRAWQAHMEIPYLDAGLDRFIWMLPKRYLDRPLWDDVLGLADRAGQEGHNLVRGMHRAIAELSRSGCCVVADHVLVEKVWLHDCAGMLAELPAYFIGVRCPLEVLEQRERERKDRTLGQARKQFNLVHIHQTYDLEVDSSTLSPQQCVEQIKKRVEAGPPEAFRKIGLAQSQGSLK
jgi:chloramphenicol 3-O phosphotransferase